MSDTPLPIQVTLAAVDTAAVARFYNAVFDAGLEPITAHGTTLYRGALAGLPFLICPNTLAGVDARQSRHQYTYQVPDVAAAVERALAAGGTLHEATDQSSVVLDPDGNSIVFVAT